MNIQTVIRENQPRNVQWRDLASMSRLATVHELALPAPWFALSLALYASAYWPLGAAASFMFFLTALRLNHEAIHGNLGLPRGADHVVLHVLSGLMLGSNHAVAFAHLNHHRYAMGPEDIEGKCGHMSAREVLRHGPQFPIEIVHAAWRGSTPRSRKGILGDAAMMLIMPVLALALQSQALGFHIAAMLTAQCLTAFFAVWITHQGTAHLGLAARSQRGWIAKAAYLMFYHREHHLFPRVPVHRLPDLANRLDASVPDYASEHLPVISILDSRYRRNRARLFAFKQKGSPK